MPIADAVLADGVLIPVTAADHLVRAVAGRWVCIRPSHRDQPCTRPATTPPLHPPKRLHGRPFDAPRTGVTT